MYGFGIEKVDGEWLVFEAGCDGPERWDTESAAQEAANQRNKVPEYKVREYVGNSGFDVREDGLIIAQFQGHYFGDAQTKGPAFYQMFEYRGDRIDEEGVFFKTQKGAVTGLSEVLAAEQVPFQKCEMCDTLLVRKQLEELVCCFSCGVIIDSDGSPI